MTPSLAGLIYKHADVEALTQRLCIIQKRDNGVISGDPIRDILVPNQFFRYKQRLRLTETRKTCIRNKKLAF